MSEELKKLLREIEAARGLRAGALGEEIEARLRGVTEPSVEKLKEVLREEMRILEERFLTRNPRSEENGICRRPTDGNPAEPGGGPWRDQGTGRNPRWGQAGGPRRHLCARCGQHAESRAASESKGLRLRENEAAQQFKYVDELCAELELAVLGGNTREVKCQRRALTSGLRQAEEAIVRTAEAHKWTKAVLERALDDVRGRALPRREEADQFLREEEQEQRSKWMSDCQRMTQNAINLASQATRALTISDWSHQDCEEFLDDLAKEFKKVNKALDTYSPQDCEPVVKRKMADCRLRQEAARFEAEKVVTRLLRDHEAWGQVSREGRQRGRASERSAGSLRQPASGKRQCCYGGAGRRKAQVVTKHPGGEAHHQHTHGLRQGAEVEGRIQRGLSGIRNSRLPTPAPRRMCPSPTESSDDEYDSYLNAARGRRAEGRSSSPRPRKSDEWRGWNKWDRPD